MRPVTARRAISDALRSPLESDGWRSHASSWWTRDLNSEWSGVLTVGAAVAGFSAGHGRAHMYVGARHHPTEDQVADLFGYRGSYRERTVVSDLGHLVPGLLSPDWLVTPETSAQVAAEIAEAARDFALPYLEALIRDSDAVLRRTNSWRLTSAPETSRHVVALRSLRGLDEARDAIHEIRRSISDRVDAAAVQQRTVLETLERNLG
jgi:hypothetical protein